MQDKVFPFTAIVGQERLKQALLCNAVCPGIGGVLISGRRGTAKSTAARALAALLPPLQAISGCRFHCDPDDPCAECKNRSGSFEFVSIPAPFVNLPIGSTEDRVLGTLDIERAIASGQKHFEPGLLASANRGVLYIDEVNLLPDHLTDILLDVASTGINRVEREGVSFTHPAEMILIGTMNPEEGDLRPQLKDRFGLYVDVEDSFEPGVRVEIMKRRAHFEKSPDLFFKEWDRAPLQKVINQAIKLLPDVEVSDELLQLIAIRCWEARIDGLRGDLVAQKTAKAFAALEGRIEVEKKDIDQALQLALGHRISPPPEKPFSSSPPTASSPPSSSTKSDPTRSPSDKTSSRSARDEEKIFPLQKGMTPASLLEPFLPHSSQTLKKSLSGKRTGGHEGRLGYYIRAKRPDGRNFEPALDAMLRAAAPNQRERQHRGGSLLLRPIDFRQKVRANLRSYLILFVVDTSGSMGGYQRMSLAKGAIFSLLQDAYCKRDQVGLISFRREEATVLLMPTRSIREATRLLERVPCGGRTPFGMGIQLATKVALLEQKKGIIPFLVFISDGRANVSCSDRSPIQEAEQFSIQIAAQSISSLWIDTETGFVRMGIMKKLAGLARGEILSLDMLHNKKITPAVIGRMKRA